MSQEIRDLLAGEPSPEDILRAAALSMRSLCQANGWERLTARRPEGYEIDYRNGEGLLFLDAAGERLAFYPETDLDDEQWMAL